MFSLFVNTSYYFKTVLIKEHAATQPVLTILLRACCNIRCERATSLLQTNRNVGTGHLRLAALGRGFLQRKDLG